VTTTIEIETLKQHIQHTAGQLEQSSGPSSGNNDDGMGSLIYLGNHQDAMPRDLILDPILESGEIHTWMLMKVHVDNPMLATRIPSQNTLMTQLKCSRPIVSRHIQVLRALRWLTLCAEVRGDDGQFRGVVYAQHDQPLSLADTLYLDPGYIEFLEQPTKSDSLRRLQNVKRGVLAHTDYLVYMGQSLNQAPTYLEQFNGRLKSQASTEPTDTHLACPTESVNPGSVANLYGEETNLFTTKIETAENHVKNFNMVNSEQNSHVNNFDMAKMIENGEKTAKHHVNNFDMVVRSSGSSSLNKTTTTPPTPPGGLNFPKAISKSARLVAYAQKKINVLPKDQQKFALNYLTDRIHAGETGTEKPVGNPIQYLAWIVTNILNDTLPETGYGERITPTSVEINSQSLQEDEKENNRRWLESMAKYGVTVDGKVGAAK